MPRAEFTNALLLHYRMRVVELMVQKLLDGTWSEVKQWKPMVQEYQAGLAKNQERRGYSDHVPPISSQMLFTILKMIFRETPCPARKYQGPDRQYYVMLPPADAVRKWFIHKSAPIKPDNTAWGEFLSPYTRALLEDLELKPYVKDIIDAPE